MLIIVAVVFGVSFILFMVVYVMGCMLVLGWVFSFFYQSLKISLPYFVFARSLRSAYSFGFFEVAPAKESWGGGEENTDLSRRESRYLDCGAKHSKTNLWLL